MPDAGDLQDLPFARVFYWMSRERLTGMLDLRDKPAAEGGKVLKRILMAGGSTFFVQGGTVQETLGEILKEKGKITPEQYETLKKECGGDYGTIEQKILTGAVVPPGELMDLVSYQVELKIKLLFTLIRGNYEFKDQSPDELNSKHVMVPVSPEKILVEGVKSHYPLARIKKEFPGIDTKTFSAAPGLKEQMTDFGVPPAAQRWVRTIPESFKWAQVIKGSPLGEEHAAAFLLAMYFADLITLPEQDEDFPVGKAYLATAREAPAGKDKKPEQKPEAKDVKPASPAEKVEPRKVEEPKLLVEEMLDREMSDEDLLEEIDKLLKVVLKRDSSYFDILGVKEETPPAKVKKIYFKFAKKFHPDARPDLFQDKVKDKVEDLFTKLTEAYDTLSDNEARAAYIKDISSKLSKEDMDKASRAIEAEMEFQKAEIMLRRGKWQEAADLLDRSVQLQPDEPEYGMYLAWAHYKIKGPTEAAKTRKVIKNIIDKRPNVADAYYYLGMIDKDEGELESAEANIRKASSMKPHDVDIKRELQLLQRRIIKAPPAKKGGLFGRKK